MATCLVTFRPRIPHRAPSRKSQKLRATHATRPSKPANDIWKLGRSIESLWEGMVEAGSATFIGKREVPLYWEEVAGRSEGRVGPDHAKAIPKATRKQQLGCSAWLQNGLRS